MMGARKTRICGMKPQHAMRTQQFIVQMKKTGSPTLYGAEHSAEQIHIKAKTALAHIPQYIKNRNLSDTSTDKLSFSYSLSEAGAMHSGMSSRRRPQKTMMNTPKMQLIRAKLKTWKHLIRFAFVLSCSLIPIFRNSRKFFNYFILN